MNSQEGPLNHLADIHSASLKLEFLAQQGSLDLMTLSTLQTALSKHAVVSAGSFFEDSVIVAVSKLFADVPLPLREFAVSQGLRRQFMRLFDFSKPNANKLFSAFGQDAANTFRAAVKNDVHLATGIRCLVQVCGERNRLVHNRYHDATSELSIADTMSLVASAKYFVRWIEDDWPEIVGELNTGD